MSWQRSYVAVSTLLDANVNPMDFLASESDRGVASEAKRELANESRVVRAKALATELAKVAQVLEELELGANASADANASPNARGTAC